MISRELDAVRLFGKWNSEHSPVRMMLACSPGGGSLSGYVAELEWPRVRIVGMDRVSEFTFDLSDASFEYAEENNVVGSGNDSEEEYPAVLVASFRSGLRLAFFEFEHLAPEG